MENKRTKVDYSIEPDLCVVIEDEEVKVYSVLLMLSSPVFNAMLSHDFKERNEGKIILKEKKKEEFINFVNCLNPGSILLDGQINIQNVYYLSKWANEYQVGFLKSACESFLISKINITKENFLSELTHATMYNFRLYTAKCISFLKQNIVICLAHKPILDVILRSKWLVPNIWKEICEIVDKPQMSSKPPDNIKDVWPFIEELISQKKKLKDFKREVKRLPNSFPLPETNNREFGKIDVYVKDQLNTRIDKIIRDMRA